MQRVLITGASGFLGSHLTEDLLRQGKRVRVLVRRKEARALFAGRPEIEVAEGDIRDARAVAAAAQGADAVIHLVSNFRKGGSDRKEAYAINVTGTENVLQAALRAGTGRLVHCSTIGVHGDVREIPADEETPFNPGDLYQETKLIAEEKVRRLARENGLPFVVVRPISMFGPGDERMLKLFRMIQKGRFVVIGDGTPLFQPAYIEDVVKGFRLALEDDRALGEAFIIGGEEYVPLRELFGIIAAELGVEPPRLKVPLPPVLWMAALCEQICIPLGIEPPLHRRRVSFFQNNRAFSIRKARALIGFEPQVTLREGIRRTIAWYREKGWL